MDRAMDSGCGSTNDAKVSLTERDIPCCLVMWKKSSRNDNSSTETLAAMSKCSIEREEGRSCCKVSVRVGLLLLVISIFGNGRANNVIVPDGNGSPLLKDSPHICAFYIA